ncbi:unnamed protein product [Anisakis simplex]|uniref:TWiK family of potassium channels protein 7 n=1 Tax=Anisakis simplex TaxID=6269 RepID=A0A0M3KAG3_ANISI|nr:unnamed protein product [Anisakis simplex]
MLQYSASINRNVHHGGAQVLQKSKSGKIVRDAPQQDMQSTITTGAFAVSKMQNYSYFQIANRAEQTLVSFQKKPPLCFRICMSAYNKYGLKHVILLLVFFFYTFFGAFVFLIIEAPVQHKLKFQWENRITANRSVFVDGLMKELFNNSQFLVYIKGGTSKRIRNHLNLSFIRYEKQLGIKWTEQKLEWDYWNAVIFAGTICTTIGSYPKSTLVIVLRYGHIYPYTNLGKVLTMIYALGGIPLVLLLLQDLGKLLTVSMKYPWFQFKRCLRRMLRLFTKQSLTEMAAIEFEERTNLYVFDVPIPAAVALIVIWLWICATVFCNLDKNWTLLQAFYFFFISLSTIGLGDLIPSSPHTLISMFGFIVFGLSLVSMVVNLIQAKMLKTYDPVNQTENTPLLQNNNDPHPNNRTAKKPFATLGVIQCFDGLKNAAEGMENSEEMLIPRRLTRSTQTAVSLPPSKGSLTSHCCVHWMTSNHLIGANSPDDVTLLVGNTEELLMKDLGETNSEVDDLSGDLVTEITTLQEDSNKPLKLPPLADHNDCPSL